MADAPFRFLIHADHGQFYVQDLDRCAAWMAEHGADPGSPPAGWTEEAVHLHRIGVEPHSIAIGTAREDLVESQITMHASVPMTEPAADHIVEADLDTPTGRLTISSPSIDPADGPVMNVLAGLLRARVSYIPSVSPRTDPNGLPGDHFLYQMDLWPADQADGVVVLKQGPNPWA